MIDPPFAIADPNHKSILFPSSVNKACLIQVHKSQDFAPLERTDKDIRQNNHHRKKYKKKSHAPFKGLANQKKNIHLSNKRTGFEFMFLFSLGQQKTHNNFLPMIITKSFHLQIRESSGIPRLILKPHLVAHVLIIGKMIIHC